MKQILLVKVDPDHGGEFCDKIVILDASNASVILDLKDCPSGSYLQFCYLDGGCSLATLIAELDPAVLTIEQLAGDIIPVSFVEKLK